MKGTALCTKCSRKEQPPVFSDIEEIQLRERTLDLKLSCDHTVSVMVLRTYWEDSSSGKKASKSWNPEKRKI